MAHTANRLIEVNRKRWEDNLKSQKDAQQPHRDMERCSHPLAPTAGHVFWRANPPGYPQFYRLDDKQRESYSAGTRPSMEAGSKMERGQAKYLKTYGITELCSISVKPWSIFKYRIPNTSVVNKVGNCRLCLCTGPKLTAAQHIWWCNLLCFLAHTTMVVLTLHFAYWRRDKSMWHDTDHMMIRIYRVSSIPSPEMIANNETKAWDNTTRWSDRFYLKDNDMPVRTTDPTLHSHSERTYPLTCPMPLQVNFATLTLSFFALSAVFHFLACVMGLWEAFWFWYWRCERHSHKLKPVPVIHTHTPIVSMLTATRLQIRPGNSTTALHGGGTLNSRSNLHTATGQNTQCISNLKTWYSSVPPRWPAMPYGF